MGYLCWCSLRRCYLRFCIADGRENDSKVPIREKLQTSYGSKIISSPNIALNGETQEEYRAVLGIPEDYTAVAILLIGYEDTTVDQTADTYSGATERNPMTDVVTYVEE